MPTSLIAGAMLAATLLAASPPADPAGKWVGTVEPNDGPNRITLVLAKASGGYTGTIEDEVGKVAKKTPLENVNWDGAALTFSFPLADGAILVKVKAEVNASRMTGRFTVSDGEAGSLVFERKK